MPHSPAEPDYPLYHHVICSNCGYTVHELHTEAIDAAVPATCAQTGLTQGSHCSVCQAVLVAQKTVPANGHDYAALVTLSTCAEDGFTTYTCNVCGDTYKGDRTKCLAHWYGSWTNDGDGAHSAACRRSGCGHVIKTSCAYSELTLGEQILRICPVCGDSADIPFEAIAGTAASVDRYALPRGELIVFKTKSPFGDEPLSIPGLTDGKARVLYAFTAGYESAGQMEAFNGKVRISLPREGLTDFTLGRLDEDGNWVEIPCASENGTLRFETNTAGLFLLIAKE